MIYVVVSLYLILFKAGVSMCKTRGGAARTGCQSKLTVIQLAEVLLFYVYILYIWWILGGSSTNVHSSFKIFAYRIHEPVNEECQGEP